MIPNSEVHPFASAWNHSRLPQSSNTSSTTLRPNLALTVFFNASRMKESSCRSGALSTLMCSLPRRSFTATVASRRPFHSIRDRLLDGKLKRYEALMLPLSRDGDGVDMLLVGLRYDDMLP